MRFEIVHRNPVSLVSPLRVTNCVGEIGSLRKTAVLSSHHWVRKLSAAFEHMKQRMWWASLLVQAEARWMALCQSA